MTFCFQEFEREERLLQQSPPEIKPTLNETHGEFTGFVREEDFKRANSE